MNMVGTPCSAVHFSAATASSVLAGSKLSFGKTAAAPWLMQARLLITMPKQ